MTTDAIHSVGTVAVDAVTAAASAKAVNNSLIAQYSLGQVQVCVWCVWCIKALLQNMNNNNVTHN